MNAESTEVHCGFKSMLFHVDLSVQFTQYPYWQSALVKVCVGALDGSPSAVALLEIQWYWGH